MSYVTVVKVTRPLADRYSKQRFFEVSSNSERFWKKSLNGQATVVGGHATVGRLSNNVFGRFKQLWNLMKRVTERSRDSGRRSRDRRPTVKQRFWTFQAIRKILKKVTERSRDSGRRSREGRPTVKQRFWTFQAIRNCFEKSHWTVTRQWSEVTRPSADCQTTFFGRFKQLGKFLKKVAEWSRDSG